MSTKFFVNQSPAAGFEPPVYDIDPIRIGGRSQTRIHIAITPAKARRKNPDDLIVIVIQLQFASRLRPYFRRIGAARTNSLGPPRAPGLLP